MASTAAAPGGAGPIQNGQRYRHRANRVTALHRGDVAGVLGLDQPGNRHNPDPNRRNQPTRQSSAAAAEHISPHVKQAENSAAQPGSASPRSKGRPSAAAENLTPRQNGLEAQLESARRRLTRRRSAVDIGSDCAFSKAPRAEPTSPDLRWSSPRVVQYR